MDRELEKERINRAAAWYQQGQLDFDRRMIKYRYESIRPYLRGSKALELGCADGEMTQFLKDYFCEVTAVDGVQSLLDLMPDWTNVKKVNSLFEDYHPSESFETIIMEHILEHVDSPVGLLQHVSRWLAPGGVLIVGVPNANSIHRLAAVKMGMLETPSSLNSRDTLLGHRRVYTPEGLCQDIKVAGLSMIELGGVFLKPVSNAQIETHWTEEMMNGFYELGKDFKPYCAEIFAVCKTQPDK